MTDINKCATVPGYPDYRVSRQGEVYSCLERGGTGKATTKWRKLKPHKETNGYYRVKFYNKDRLAVHQVVARTYIGEQVNGIQVNHIDGDKLNNRLNNLEYVTPKQNTQHAIMMGLTVKRPKNEPEFSTEVIAVNEHTNSWARFPSMSEADRFGYSKGCIALVVAGKREYHRGLRWLTF